jgi:hypothetical protein
MKQPKFTEKPMDFFRQASSGTPKGDFYQQLEKVK